MAHRPFYSEEGHRRAVEAVHRVEAMTSAQVVVALRSHAAGYRQTDFLFGAACGLATLVAAILLPFSFAEAHLPFDVAVGFAAGALLCASLAPLRRGLTPGGLLRENVHRAACAAFVDHVLGRTRTRRAVLIYAGLFERRVEVLLDSGVEVAPLGAAWDAAIEELSRSVREGPDLDDFIAAIDALGPLLARILPGQGTDAPELPPDLATEGRA